jgi:4-diphosphocytidyl-2-C-methyl-D-erythritol kinase
MMQARAHAKINLALVVGPLQSDGRHEVVTVLQQVELHDDVALEAAERLVVEGFEADTIVREALTVLAGAAKVEPCWRVRIEKRIPVAAGLGGGSADAAAALRLANESLPRPLRAAELHGVAAEIGADVPFFLVAGPQLGTGIGTELEPIALPTDYHVVLLLPHGETKLSTGAVYDAFEARAGAPGFDTRARTLRDALSSVAGSRDLVLLPANDLGSSPHAAALLEAGAFRADVTGAGPAVYGLFEHADEAESAARALSRTGRTLVTRPLVSGDHVRVAR